MVGQVTAEFSLVVRVAAEFCLVRRVAAEFCLVGWVVAEFWLFEQVVAESWLFGQVAAELADVFDSRYTLLGCFASQSQSSGRDSQELKPGWVFVSGSVQKSEDVRVCNTHWSFCPVLEESWSILIYAFHH